MNAIDITYHQLGGVCVGNFYEKCLFHLNLDTL